MRNRKKEREETEEIRNKKEGGIRKKGEEEREGRRSKEKEGGEAEGR